MQSFENEWVEVEIKAPKGWCEPPSSGSFPPMTISSCDTVDESNVVSFLKDDLDISDIADEAEWQGIYIFYIIYIIILLSLINFKEMTILIYFGNFFLVPLYKHTHLDIDINNKSDRIEWGHLRYQSIYKVDHSYELVVQWVASSGSIVADLVSRFFSYYISQNYILKYNYYI